MVYFSGLKYPLMRVHRKGGRGIRQNVDGSRQGNGLMICAMLVNIETHRQHLTSYTELTVHLSHNFRLQMRT